MGLDLVKFGDWVNLGIDFGQLLGEFFFIPGLFLYFWLILVTSVNYFLIILGLILVNYLVNCANFELIVDKLLIIW